MSEKIEIQTGVTGNTAPNQPMYEGNDSYESEASQERQVEQPTEQGYEVPDKFILEDGSVNVEALAKSYAELERGNATPQTQNTETSQETENTYENFPLTSQEMDTYYKEFSDTGVLSEESFANMEAKGLPRELVQQYVNGQKALRSQSESELLGIVGGQEAYDTMTEWAQNNLNEAEIQAYDSVMNSGDGNQIQMAIQGLYARYSQSTNRPTLLQGDTGSTGSTQAFRSWAEVTAAMKDPKYQKDPAYRDDIQRRLAVSQLQG